MAGLEGRVSIVTGAAQGIGRVIALELAAAGADVVVADILEEGMETVAAEVRKLGRRALTVRLDVSDEESAKAAVEATMSEFGQVDHLVNNAGITRDNLLMRMRPEEWSSVLAVNLSGVYNCTHSVVRYMMKRRYGRIVSITSVVGQMGNPGQTNYGATKAGVIGFTKSAARELGSRGITVNAVAPGFIESPMTDVLSDEIRERLMANVPLARLGLPEDVAKAVKFLVSDDASYITGAVINVNGGMYM
ncbi:MAG TPA: 3-oxoacyl-[acyl-carrier-protein] reductase [Acidobacteriota bacterium]|nr:3-oxoacyl-[acyl-carrier-protein] reductase [Acidobacteriota bacterium]